MASGPFVKVYQSIVDDPMMAAVYADDRLLATWLRLLLVADAMYPVSAPLFGKPGAIAALVDAKLITLVSPHRYTIRGLVAERKKRSAYGRNAVEVRWANARNAEALLVEKSREEKSGSHGERVNGVANVPVHDGRHPDCIVCAGTA